MTDIEKVARAIWDQQRNHWGHYRDMVPDLCEWEELTQSKQRELMREAKAAIAAMQPAPQEPVAWMYERDDGSRDLLLDCNGEYARNLLELGATETPLYAHPPAPQWHGIETAPNDGSWIMLYDDRYKHSEHSYLIAQWHIPLKVWAGKKNSKGRFTLWDDATHWMPLPTPPAGGSDAAS